MSNSNSGVTTTDKRSDTSLPPRAYRHQFSNSVLVPGSLLDGWYGGRLTVIDARRADHWGRQFDGAPCLGDLTAELALDDGTTITFRTSLYCGDGFCWPQNGAAIRVHAFFQQQPGTARPATKLIEIVNEAVVARVAA